jgi:hypothetical protein
MYSYFREPFDEREIAQRSFNLSPSQRYWQSAGLLEQAVRLAAADHLLAIGV